MVCRSGKAPLVSYVPVFGHSTLQTTAKDTVVFKRSGITVQDYVKHRAQISCGCNTTFPCQLNFLIIIAFYKNLL